MNNAKILGIGSAIPEKVLTNADLEKMVDTSDEWITTRTGIKTRYIADENTASSDLATEAAKEAIQDAGITPEDLDMIILGTVTPDMAFPNTATIVQKNLGIKNIPCFDIEAACTGFIYGVSIATSFIKSGDYKNILVIGVETLSKICNWKDRNTCVLFGDGAGAAVITKAEDNDESKILSIDISSDGTYGHLLVQKAGGSRIPASHESIDKGYHYIEMAGGEVFKNAVKSMSNSSLKAVQKAGISVEEIDWVITHQANIRIIEATAKRLKQPKEKVIVTVDKFGNTSAASIPMALVESKKEGKFKKGDVLVLSAFGGGLTWGSIVLKW